ncbi:MAG: TonB-dependent receptor plug domain-containing protein [Algibacter sp.]
MKLTPHLNIKSKLLLCCFISSIAVMTSQNNRIKGCVTDKQGKEVVGAHVTIIGFQETNITDYNGCFSFLKPKQKNYTLKVSYLGYENYIQELNSEEIKTLDIQLVEEATALTGVVIQGKSKAEKQREQAYAINVIKTDIYKNSNIDVNQVLNQVPGIIVRKEGGLGSSFDLSLNGLSGNQVRIFIDGIPMNYFGSSLSLNNFPTNVIESIEVYKGVVPIHLPADALGGAINIITNKNKKNYLDLTYSLGSFNTHIASINGQHYNKENGFTMNLKSFYNYSDNDYKIDVFIPLSDGRIPSEKTTVKRFHDAYTSKMVQLELGVTQKKYADELLFGFLFSDNYKELQNKPLPDKVIFPFGEVHERNESYISTLKYKKKQLIKNVDISSFIAFINAQKKYIDNSDFKYDWFGNTTNIVPSTTGEYYRKTDLTLNQKNIISNINLQYHLYQNQLLTFNLSSNYYRIKGNDPLSEQNLIQFGNPSTTNKYVAGLSYSFNNFNKKLSNTFFVKGYDYKINGIETDPTGVNTKTVERKEDYLGLGMASTFRFTKHAQIKLSFEKAIRFPENLEILGNGIEILTHINLKPETSYNLNIGYRIKKYFQNDNQLHFETNLFYRNAENYIYVRPELVFKTYDNLENVLTKGIESEIQYTFLKKYVIGINATYLDIREKSEFLPATFIPNTYYNSRIPNIPYLFGNVNFRLNFNNLLQKNDTFSITSQQQYVHEYSLYFDEIAEEDLRRIPTQFSQNIEFTYTDKKEKYNLSFAVNNLFDSNLTDNFNLQKPGINFNFKLRYHISK